MVESVTDPYLDGVYRWWHLTGPSPELVAAADGWLPPRGTVLAGQRYQDHADPRGAAGATVAVGAVLAPVR